MKHKIALFVDMHMAGVLLVALQDFRASVKGKSGRLEEYRAAKEMCRELSLIYSDLESAGLRPESPVKKRAKGPSKKNVKANPK